MSDLRQAAFVNAADERYIQSDPDAAQRAVMTDSVMRYRRADSLNVGDPLPALTLTRLTDGAPVPLAGLAGLKPLVLIFGTYT